MIFCRCLYFFTYNILTHAAICDIILIGKIAETYEKSSFLATILSDKTLLCLTKHHIGERYERTFRRS